MSNRIVYRMGKPVVWTRVHDRLYGVWKRLDDECVAHGHSSTFARSKCMFCDSRTSIVHSILDYMSKTLNSA